MLFRAERPLVSSGQNSYQTCTAFTMNRDFQAVCSSGMVQVSRSAAGDKFPHFSF